MSLIVFTHMYKTGGTSLRRYLDAAFDLKTQKLPPVKERVSVAGSVYNGGMKLKPRHLRVLYGHMYYGIHDYIDQPISYLTLIREPIDRVLSRYNHCMTVWSHYDKERYTEVKNMSFEEWLTTSWEANDSMVRWLSGIHKLKLPKTAVDQAIKNLSNYAHVGRTDDLERTVKYLRGVHDADPKINIGHEYCEKKSMLYDGDKYRTKLPENAEELVRKYNQLDCLLWERLRC